jgi:hypothetical protein
MKLARNANVGGRSDGTGNRCWMRKRILAAAGCVLVVAGAGLAAVWCAQRAAGGNVSEELELKLAVEDARAALAQNPGCPPDQVDELLPGAVVVLHPHVALRELRKDPSFVATEQAAIAAFLHPEAIVAEWMKDPEFRRQDQEARRQIANPDPGLGRD